VNFVRAQPRPADLESVPSWALTRDYKQRIVQERVPVSASIELTMRCNLDCTHCYCPPGQRPQELSSDEIKALFDRMAELGTLYLLMTGGEPLLRKDFAELYRHAKNLGLLVTVFTNGTLVTDEIIALWNELPPHLIEISLYGHSREVYERVVEVEGSYDRCLAGIERILAAGHRLALKCPVTRENAHEIPLIQEFARERELDFRYDPVILATMEGKRHPHELRLSPQEIVKLEANDDEKDRAWKKYMTEEEHPQIPGDTLFSCGAGKNSFHVDPYGNVQVCLMVKNFKHSLREQSFEEIYFERFPDLLAIKRQESSKCGGCAQRSVCTSCPGAALWETQNLHSNVDFACQLSEARDRTYRGAAQDARADAAASAGCASGGACAAGGCGGTADPQLLQIGGGS